MVSFNVFIPGTEKERIERILNYGIEDKIVTDYHWVPAGGYGNKYGRLQYTITSGSKSKAQNIRLRLGCRYSGTRKDTYHTVDERGYYFSKEEDIDYSTMREN